MSTQPCICPGSLNRVPASAGGKGGILTSAGWQVTSGVRVSRSGDATLLLTAIHCLLTYFTYSSPGIESQGHRSRSKAVTRSV